MIKQFKINDKEYGMILGFEALKVLAEGQSKGSSEFQMIEDMAFVSINAYDRRFKGSGITRDELIEILDEPESLFIIQEAVEEFSENFSSKAAQRQKKVKK